MRRRTLSLYLLLATVLGATLALSACGQKGDLYLPDQTADKKERKQ